MTAPRRLPVVHVDAGVPIAADALTDSIRTGAYQRPIAVKVQLLDNCNARCRMCNHWRRPEPRTFLLDLPFLRRLLQDLARLGTRVVRFTGGEPTLRHDLVDIIAAARGASIIPELNTHAMRIDGPYARALVDAGLRRACVSMHSSDPSVHDAIFGVEDAWRKAWAGLAALRAAAPADRLALRLHVVVMHPNLGAVSGLPRLAASAGVDEIHLQAVEVSHLNDSSGRVLAVLPEEAAAFNERVLPDFLAECGRLGVVTNVVSADRSPIRGLGQPTTQPRCFRPYYDLLITEDGSAYPCSQLNDDELVIGNVRETPLEQMIGGPAHLRAIAVLRGDYRTCRTCTWQLKRNLLVDEAIEAPR